MKRKLWIVGLFCALLLLAAPPKAQAAPTEAAQPQTVEQQQPELPTGGRIAGRTQRISNRYVAPEEPDGRVKAATQYNLKFADGDTFYAYDDLKNQDNADARRKLYRRILKDAYTFENSGKTAPKLSGSYYFSAIRYTSYGVTYNDALEVAKAFHMDHPSCYWINTNLMMTYNDSSFYLGVDKTFAKASQRKTAEAAITKTLNAYKNATKGLTSKRDIAQVVHDKICAAVEYNKDDLAGIYSQSMMGVMDNSVHKTVCAGYSKAYAFLLRSLGVNALYVEGYANGGKHAWNLVQLDNGKWYWNDVTWDDTSYTTQYFNCPNKYFIKQHYINTPEFTGYDYMFDIPAPSNTTYYAYQETPTVFRYGGHTYAYYPTQIKWTDAKKFCEDVGGTLAIISSKEEQNALNKTKALQYENYWIGARRPAKGKWQWIDGTKWSYTNWTKGNVDSYKNQDSYVYVNASGTWDIYIDESYRNGILCEWNDAPAKIPVRTLSFDAGYFKPYGVNISTCKITGVDKSLPYDGWGATPYFFDLKRGSTVLNSDDYTYTCKNNDKTGTATLVVYGSGFYCGVKTKTYQITKATPATSSFEVKKPKAQTYTGKPLKPNPTISHFQWRLRQGTDYTLSYKNNGNAGTATVTVRLKGNYSGTLKTSFSIQPASIKPATVAKVYEQKYTGKAVKPGVTVKIGDKTLKRGTDYTVSYTNNVKVGKATIAIKGKGNYSGTIHRSFQIVKRPTTAVVLNKSAAELVIGDTLQLKATIRPANASTKTLTWTSSKSSVATVSKSGKVTAKKAGKTTFTVRTASGKTAKCVITVTKVSPQPDSQPDPQPDPQSTAGQKVTSDAKPVADSSPVSVSETTPTKDEAPPEEPASAEKETTRETPREEIPAEISETPVVTELQ